MSTTFQFSLFDFNKDTGGFENFHITNGETLEQLILEKQYDDPYGPIEYDIEDDILIVGTEWIFGVMSCFDYSNCILIFNFDKQSADEYNKHVVGPKILVDDKLFTARTDQFDDTMLVIDTSESSEKVVLALKEALRKQRYIGGFGINNEEDDSSNNFSIDSIEITIILKLTLEILIGSSFYDM